MSKLILVIGGTGAQGLAVVDALLKPQADGSPSPYSVRVFTRNPTHRRALELKEKGCELFQGSIGDLDSVSSALQGVYGAFVNTDGFTVGEKEETYLGLRIFELAKQTGTVKHYVWSSLDYMHKAGGFQPQYRCGHYDGKGRITDFLRAQTSDPNEMIWTSYTNGPYMEMLFGGLFVPFKTEDGTAVWALPLGDGHIPLIALQDLGFFARWVFDNPLETSGKDIQVASHRASGKDIIDAFTKVTGKPAVYIPLTTDEYFSSFKNADAPVAPEAPQGLTFRQNFTGFWNGWKDDIVHRDMEWLKSIHPGLRSVESWMREHEYDGVKEGLLKKHEDRDGVTINYDNIKALLTSKLQ